MRVKLLRAKHRSVPGTTIRAYGHDFIVQPNLDLVCDMHPDFIPIEVAAGRVQPMEEAVEQEDINAKLLEMGLTFDPENCYGCEDPQKLRKCLNELSKKHICEFLRSAFGLDVPHSRAKFDLVQLAFETARKECST